METFIIAEAGVNHNGSLELAKELVNVAYDAGADAVKFQTFCTDNLVCQKAPKAEYQKLSTSLNESQYEMLKRLELSRPDQVELNDYCKKKGVQFLSSPFDLVSVNFLCHTLDLSIIKIASGEITNLPLLLAISRAGKKCILSTGMSTLGDIEAALSVLAFGYIAPSHVIPSVAELEAIYCSQEGQKILEEKVSLLHCTSEYPAPFEEINLRVIKTLQKSFGLLVGYSDHTLGTTIPIAAVACGAKIIEKHFTLDKSMSGPDHQASLEPEELTAMVLGIRQTERALGSFKKIPTNSEFKNRVIARKSLVALENIAKGDLFTEQNLGCKRPGQGISPFQYYSYENARALRDFQKDELIGI